MISSMTFAGSAAGSLMSYFPDLKNPFTLKLPKLTEFRLYLCKQKRNIYFFSLSDSLQNLETFVEYSYFYGNIVI